MDPEQFLKFHYGSNFSRPRFFADSEYRRGFCVKFLFFAIFTYSWFWKWSFLTKFWFFALLLLLLLFLIQHSQRAFKCYHGTDNEQWTMENVSSGLIRVKFCFTSSFVLLLLLWDVGDLAEMVVISKWWPSNVVSEIVSRILKKKIFFKLQGGPKWEKPGLAKKNSGLFFSLKGWKGVHSTQNSMLIKKSYRSFFRISSRFREISQKLVFWAKRSKNGKSNIIHRWCVWGVWNCAYNHYLGCWVRFCSQKYHCIMPYGSYWKNFARLEKFEKIENRNFSTLMRPGSLKLCL